MQRRRRPRNRYLENLGTMPPGAMLAFGLALILLLASVGIVGAALVRHGAAAPQVAQATPSPTEFLALVETPAPTPEIVTATVVITPTARATAIATRPRATATRIVNAPLGSGQSRAARGIAGAMAAALGGVLPPVAAAPPPTPTRVPTAAPPTERPYTPPPAYNPPPVVYNPPVVNNPPAAPTPTATPLPTPTPAPLPTQTPTPPPSPTVPPLPPVALPTPAPRPYTYNLTYTLQADLTTAPGADYAYTVTWHTFTAAEVATLKGALGLKGPVQQTATGFTVTDPGTLTINNQTGVLTYTAPGVTAGPAVSAFAAPTVTAPATATRTATTSATTTVTTSAATTTAAPGPTATAAPKPTATSAPPTATTPPAPAGTPGPTPPPALNDDTALAVANQWLSTSALLPPNADGGHVTRPAPDEIVVTYRPKSPGPLILGDPAVVVTLDAKGAVRTATYRWPEDVTQRPVRLRPAADAWADAQAGKGYLQVDQTIPANLPSGTVYKGAATVTNVDIGWTTATNDSGTYLVPVYVFSGTVALDGQPQGTPPTPFRIYVPAVAPATP
ncbi:MAG: hypothetical protein ACTHMJ_17330 [Thermomicrobiales bacterium]|nr:hypothetical protein [Thermomicrobiales bacterium]